MNLSLLILKSGEYIITQSEELIEEPRCHLIEPHSISGKTKLTLTPWPQYTNDKHILLRSDDLLTVCEPTEEIIQSYLNMIGKTIEEFEKEQQPDKVLLQEGEGVPEGDEYEPRYQEMDDY